MATNIGLAIELSLGNTDNAVLTEASYDSLSQCHCRSLDIRYELQSQGLLIQGKPGLMHHSKLD